MIPKIVHQTWKTPHFEYWVFKRSQISVQEHLANWDYRFWTDDDLEELVREAYPQYLEDWAALNQPIKRVDMARYFLLHRFGGIYADLDFIFKQSLDPLIDGRHRLYFYRSQEAITKGWQFLGNAFMMSAPAEPFWLDLVDFQLSLPANTPVLHHTGPRSIGAFSEMLEDRSHIRIFGPDEFDNEKCETGVGASRYGHHVRTATWQHPDFQA
ncbi:MAG: hypothetical protein KDM64_09835 [Verrucomicrobiae bacterium]|nr:hypothetical protein [Verrucomicrobiae bacterium]MCB1078113.1 hypothetical protein [Verrucomicrobiae bacterium]